MLYSTGNYFHKTWIICSFLKAKQSTCLSFKHGDHGDVGNRGWKQTFRCHWQISRQKWINLRSIIIIKQIQNMNLMLNMKDINKILAKTHFKCKKKVKKTHIFAKTCLPVMPSLLLHVLQGRSQVSLFFASVVSPDLTWPTPTYTQGIVLQNYIWW